MILSQWRVLQKTMIGMKELGPRMAKLALWLIKFMKYGIVHFLLYEYLEESLNYAYIPNIHL